MSLLERISVFLVFLYAALRVHGTGLDTAEPETVFLSIVSVTAFALSYGDALYREKRLYLPPGGFCGWLAAFAAFAGIAVFTAGRGGYSQAALDLGGNWLADILLLLAAVNTAARRDFSRELCAALLAGLALTVAFGLYQRFYGLDYLRSVLNSDGAAALKNLGDAFQGRLASERISGQFAYANAFAGFVIMLLPLLTPFFRNREKIPAAARRLAYGLLFTALLVLAYSGSKAGFIVAKIGEICLLLHLAEQTDVPAGRRPNWGERLSRGLTFAGLCGILTALAFAGRFAAARVFGEVCGESFFAVLWCGEILFLGRLAMGAEMPVFFRRAGHFACGLGLTLGLAGGLCVFDDAVAAQTIKALRAENRPAAAERLLSARAEIHKQLGVRGNYWASAVAMIKDRPLGGYGLDNFGNFYSRYKRPGGWEVRRAHNLYLQLAVDGGIFLLFAFAGLWFAFFRTKRAEDVPARTSRPAENGFAKDCTKFAVFAGIAAFAATYGLFYCGAFNGLGVEFFFSELARRGGGNFSALALFVHTLANWLLLPAAWFGAYLLFRRAAEVIPAREFATCAYGGVALALGHFFFDFHYYQAVNSGYFWLLAATALVAAGRTREWILTEKTAQYAVAGIIVGATAAMVFWLSPQFTANVTRAVAEKMALDPRPETLLNLRALDEAALAGRPGDVSLWLRRAETLSRLGDPAAAETAARRALALNPVSTSNKFFLARLLENAPFTNPKRLQEIQQLYRDAIDGYPRKPAYRLAYAVFLQRRGIRDEDFSVSRLARTALELSAATTDAAAILSPEERRLAEKLALTP